MFTGTVRFVQSETKDAWLQISTFLAVAAADVADVVVDVVVVLLLAVELEGVADVVAAALVEAALPPLLLRWLSPTPSPTPNPIARMSTNPTIMPQNAATGRPRTLLLRPASDCIAAPGGLLLFFAYCSLYGGANDPAVDAYCWPGCVASRPSLTTAWGRSWLVGAISGP